VGPASLLESGGGRLALGNSWVFPGFARLGKLSVVSDRLNSHGSVDRRRLFTWCGGGGRL
jgi:hypothetical protein